MEPGNAIYAQSGGVTAVMNATACGVIQTSRKHSDQINTLYAARHGILGALTEDLIDTSLESDQSIAALRYTPAGAFGSCRYQLGQQDSQFERLIAVFAVHRIRYFFYNGGGDSQDTTYKIARMSQKLNYSISCIGIPKTIDNDLPFTDNSPGFGSVAKYVATSVKEASMDVASMALTSTKIFILEVMGRHSGWIAAASGLATNPLNDGPPHIILFPEIPLQVTKLIQYVQKMVKKHGYCSIVVAEGLKNENHTFIATTGCSDAFDHQQLGGVAPIIAHLIKSHLNYKCHWAVSDYLQRSARHIAAKVDVDQAYAVGQAAVEMALAGKNAIMPTIIRQSQDPYHWSIGEADLKQIANQEVALPLSFIREDGFHITETCRQYLLPLIQGEDYPPYHEGLPNYIHLKNVSVAKKLAPFMVTPTLG